MGKTSCLCYHRVKATSVGPPTVICRINSASSFAQNPVISSVQECHVVEHVEVIYGEVVRLVLERAQQLVVVVRHKAPS